MKAGATAPAADAVPVTPAVPGITACETPNSTQDDVPINILIVDDEPKNLTVLETILHNPGYRVVRATSGDEALLALIAEEFALLILDIQMPGLTGFELAQVIKERKKTAHVPIIFLTAYYNEDEHVLAGYGSGAVDFLHKPVNAAILRSKVSAFVDLYRRNLEFIRLNGELVKEVEERRQIQAQLFELNETLEQRVLERTEALREKELRLRQAADAARLTYVETNFLKREVRKAENFAAVMGHTTAAAESPDFDNGTGHLVWHVAPQDRERVAIALSQFGGSKSSAKLDYRVLGDDGMERWIESQCFVEYDPAGNPVRSFLTNLDVTDRERAQEQLRESEERFRQLADSMPQMVWTARGDGYFDYFNARWQEFTGFTPGNNGDPAGWDPIIHCDDRKNWVDHWNASLTSGDSFRLEYRLWDSRSNQYKWFLGRAISLRGNDGGVVKWIGTCTDIDEQKRTETDLRRANAVLEQFAFAASHDLQEPLRTVAIYTQLLQRQHGPALTGDAGEYMRLIVEGAQRMRALVAGLLDYIQIPDSNQAPESNVDAAQIFDEVRKDLNLAMEEAGARISSDALPTVQVRDIHLRQILQNLIGNALKFRRDGETPRIHVTARRLDRQWCFSVSDNGMGIPPEYKDHIFGVFKRLHPSGGKYGGAGIGLAISQRIVESYGGRIWVESTVGQGATFCFTLPAGEGD